MVDLNLLNFQDSLNNQQNSKFKPSNFGMKFEDILVDSWIIVHHILLKKN